MVAIIEGVVDVFAGECLDEGEDMLHEVIDVVFEDIDCSGSVDFQLLVEISQCLQVSPEDGIEPDLVLQLQSPLDDIVPGNLCEFLHAGEDVVLVDLIARVQQVGLLPALQQSLQFLLLTV